MASRVLVRARVTRPGVAQGMRPPLLMVLLTIHGCAGVLWSTSSQMLLYDIVGAGSLTSAVRLNATARYLGSLVGPGVGRLIR